MSTNGTYTLQEDDICLVAYPKSGNNFLLFLVAALLYRQKIDWKTKGAMIQNVKTAPIENLPTPHLVWSHEKYDPAYPKVINLVRDPRDIVISYHHHVQKYYGDNRDFGAFFQAFLDGEIATRWDTHVESWLDNQNKIQNGFLLIKYEDLLHDTTQEAQRLLQFLNLDRNDQEITEAVNWASFDNMKALEQKQQSHLDGNLPSSNKSMPFVREGKAYKWKSVLSEEQERQINQTFAQTLARLGYQ